MIAQPDKRRAQQPGAAQHSPWWEAKAPLAQLAPSRGTALGAGLGVGCFSRTLRFNEEREGFFAFSDCLNIFLDFLSAKRVTLTPASELSMADAA